MHHGDVRRHVIRCTSKRGYRPQKDSAQNLAPLEVLNAHKDRRVYQKAGSLSYQTPLGVDRQAFVEFFGEPDVDDPLGDFHSYLMDPVNWDPSAQIEQRFVYGTNIGLQQQANLIGDNSIIRIGLRTRAEEAQVSYVSTHESNQL